jgi:ABC-type transport system involved in multi-copper enzyme maturation permease subunit
MIASFITILAFMVFNAIFNAVVASVAYGTFNTLFDPVLYYNFNTQTVIELNTLTASLLSLAGILPEIIILLLFAVLVSILTGNTAVSIILGFVLAFSETLFGGLVSKVKLLTFFPIFNWNLTTYFFGGMNYIKNMSFGKSLIVDIVTIIGLLIACIIVFKKKDIKNQ